MSATLTTGAWSACGTAPTGDLGLRANPVQGFIYADGAPNKAPSFKAPVWAQNDWKPGNGLEIVAASLGQ